MTWLHGVDLSHYQADSQVPWTLIQQTSRFAIVKATDGTKPDPACSEHVQRARALGMTVGLYHFFRDPIPVAEQFDAFSAVADACVLTAGDMLPCLDVEDYPGHQIGFQTSGPAEEWCAMARETWGGAIFYTSQRDWNRMNAPAWVLSLPLWVAHYPGRELPGPATPDHRDWRIWQYAVHPYAPGVWTNDFKAAKAIDHNWALDPLPLIVGAGQVAVEPEPLSPAPHIMADIDWAELRAARDRDVQAEDFAPETPRTT